MGSSLGAIFKKEGPRLEQRGRGSGGNVNTEIDSKAPSNKPVGKCRPGLTPEKKGGFIRPDRWGGEVSLGKGGGQAIESSRGPVVPHTKKKTHLTNFKGGKRNKVIDEKDAAWEQERER